MSTTRGRAPLSQARATSRSTLASTGSGCSATTSAAMSTLAHSTWPWLCSPGGCADHRGAPRQEPLDRDPVVRPLPQHAPVPGARARRSAPRPSGPAARRRGSRGAGRSRSAPRPPRGRRGPRDPASVASAAAAHARPSPRSQPMSPAHRECTAVRRARARDFSDGVPVGRPATGGGSPAGADEVLRSSCVGEPVLLLLVAPQPGDQRSSRSRVPTPSGPGRSPSRARAGRRRR